MQRPVMIFDGECGFCRRWIATWQRLTGDRVEYVAYQDLGDRFPELPREQFTRSVVLVEADGRVSHAAEAVCRSFAVGAGYRWLLWLYQRVPGIAPTMEAAYWFVAGHRQLFSALTPRDMPFAATRWWFLRLLGVVYLIAFVSLWTQVIGLIGERGILPASALMQQARQYFGGVNGWDFPTLCWFTASDAMLHGLCAAGVVLALLVIVDVVALPALWGLWALYLSLCTVGGVFMGYQWDSLLTEVGLLAALWASGSRTMLWLLRWLWFRLMFAAGVVKLSSGDALWRSLKTLTIHYETQPLPTWIGWWAHQLPAGVQVVCCALVFVVELAVPFLLFAPRRWRMAGAGATAALMVLIALTGNYCFFNLLTMTLCLLLLDDEALPAWARRLARVRPPTWRRWVVLPVAVALLAMSIPPLVSAFRVRVDWPGWLTAGGAWRSVNGYGLFAAMTNPRYEIVVEGSDDGQRWVAYEFKYKPGRVERAPAFVAPHQPRVDWQMWFAALGNYQQNPWFMNFCGRLLQGETAVLRLVAHNPFPGKPPRMIRARLYEYHFTTVDERRATGEWWRRELKGEYCPVLSLSAAN